MSNYTLRTLLKKSEDRTVQALCARWNGQVELPEGRTGQVAHLAEMMESSERVQHRLKELPQKLSDLLDTFLGEPSYQRDVRSIMSREGTFRSAFDVEAALAALNREGFLFPAVDRRWDSFQDACYAVPGELADCITALRLRQERELESVLTLGGFLRSRFYDKAAEQDDPERAADHSRKIYKLYLMEGSVSGRIKNLPAGVGAVFERVLHAFGGIMPVSELSRITDELEVDVDVDLLKKCFEDNMLGTVAPMRLTRFGLEPLDQAVIVFHEIVMMRLQWMTNDISVDCEEALSSGVDLVTNVGRFLREIMSSKVQFTVDGELYKASSKRIMGGFLDVPGGFMPQTTQIKMIFKFCLSRRLIERSGERALRLSDAGHDFEQLSLQEKLKSLLAFAVEERAPQGEHYHQVRLRRMLLRLFRRVEVDQWHEALFIPFLARNGYLAKLHELHVEEFFAARFKGGGYRPTETIQQVCMHLLDFVKRRLYPFGLVDLGLRDGRPVALRLSRLGAELLGAESANDVGGARSTVVVNPDFEMILFPGDDEHEVVHSFDRFSVRLKTDHIHHFRIEKQSVQAALTDGMSLAQIVQELTDRSRSPLPQNVVYSLEDWADQAGLLSLSADLVLSCRRTELLESFLGKPAVKGFAGERLSETSVQILADTDLDRLRDVARDLGFLIERAS